MTRPLVLVYQELAQQTPQIVEPDLPALALGAAYQILDYADDKATIEVASYGTLAADNPYAPPTANTPAIVLAAPPAILPGAWVDPASIQVVFDDLRVILASGSDGSSTNNQNSFASAGATFVTDGVQVGDILIVDNPAGPLTPNLKLTVREVVSETALNVSSNFTATVAGTLNWRIERRMDDQVVAATFVVPPTFRQSNEITILGGVTVTVGTTPRDVAYARVYVGYRAYRTDLQPVGTISGSSAITDIQTKVGKIDARNPLAAHLFVMSQNAGNSSVYFYGVETDDLVGYTKARDAISSNKIIYAEVVATESLAIMAMLKADNLNLSDPATALATGVPQKFRVALGSEALVTVEEIVLETATATTEKKTGATPPGVKYIEIAAATFMSAGVKPGDQLILSYSENASPLDGTYTIAHINSQTELELDRALPATVVAAEGANYRVYRPSLATNVIAEVEARASLLHTGVRFYSKKAGITPGARTIVMVDSGVANNRIASIVEVPNVSTTITLDLSLTTTLTAADVAAAVNAGTGVVTPFTGSVNLTAVAVTPSTTPTAVSAALSTGTAGLDVITSTDTLDDVFIRLFDSAATFITDGVLPGDIIEIPSNPNGVFGAIGTKQFVVNQVLSEQRLEIVNTVAGSYVNNTSTVENELPHYDNRLGLNTLVTQASIRYRVTRNLSKDQQISTLAAMAQSLRSQRTIMCWPDLVEVSGLVDGSKPRNADGSAALADPQPGTYLAAVVGGMTAGLPNHQGFSRLGVAGIGRLYHSTGYFTEEQLSTLSDSGWYVFVQDTPESLPYTIHQLTTDPSALQTGEYSMVKNFDYLSKFFVTILDRFIGVWNVNEETLGFIRQAINSGIDQLKGRRYARIGAPLIDASIASLSISTASADRVELYMNLDRPTPLNTISAHLVG